MATLARARSCDPWPYGPPMQNTSLDDPWKGAQVISHAPVVGIHPTRLKGLDMECFSIQDAACEFFGRLLSKEPKIFYDVIAFINVNAPTIR